MSKHVFARLTNKEQASAPPISGQSGLVLPQSWLHFCVKRLQTSLAAAASDSCYKGKTTTALLLFEYFKAAFTKPILLEQSVDTTKK